MTGWCSNIGDASAVMRRPGNAGSFTAADHLAVLKAAFAQVPAGWRIDVLVSIDGAGASHEVIDHLSALNTAPEHGRRGRRVEYTIGRSTNAPCPGSGNCATATEARPWTPTAPSTPPRTSRT